MAPTPPLSLPYDAITHLRTDGVRILEIVTDHGLGTPVPACPGWDLGELAWHLGGIWNRWAQVVTEGHSTAEETASFLRPPRPADDLLVDWVTASHTALLSALTDADPDAAIWTWTGTQQIRWVLRRMTQETAVHRRDASDAVGIPYELPAAVAADGIDEYLMWFAGHRTIDGAVPVGGTVHLHCTDLDTDVAEGSDDRAAAPGEWLVTSIDDSGARFTRMHAKGDVAVRGRSHDLLMWVWRRSDDGVEILGDASVAARFRDFTRL